jgi:hypothetical protein
MPYSFNLVYLFSQIKSVNRANGADYYAIDCRPLSWVQISPASPWKSSATREKVNSVATAPEYFKCHVARITLMQ